MGLRRCKRNHSLRLGSKAGLKYLASWIRRPRVSIIIPVFAPKLLPACLRSLAANVPPKMRYEVIVVFNQAGSEEEQQLRRTSGDIRITTSAVNLGLAGAANRGRALARGDLLVVLHDDAEVESGWLEALVTTA